MSKKLKYFSPNVETACAWYRSVYPMSSLGERMKTMHWSEMAEADIIFVERPQTQEGLKNCSRVKVMGKKLWVDVDDSLYNLPEYNRYKDFYDAEWDSIRKCIEMSDVVTTATDVLKNEYSKINKNTITVRNAIDTDRFTLPDAASDNRKILWRGSDTHSIDLLTVLPQIKKVSDAFPDWQWFFVGAFVPYITEHVRNSKNIYTWTQIPDYFATITAINPAITIAPLQFNDFNACKSNISFQESTMCGGVTLAANVEDFRITPANVYNTPEEFEQILVDLIENKGRRAESYAAARDYLRDKNSPHNLHSQNEIRRQIIENL